MVSPFAKDYPSKWGNICRKGRSLQTEESPLWVKGMKTAHKIWGQHWIFIKWPVKGLMKKESPLSIACKGNVKQYIFDDTHFFLKQLTEMKGLQMGLQSWSSLCLKPFFQTTCQHPGWMHKLQHLTVNSHLDTGIRWSGIKWLPCCCVCLSRAGFSVLARTSKSHRNRSIQVKLWSDEREIKSNGIHILKQTPTQEPLSGKPATEQTLKMQP